MLLRPAGEPRPLARRRGGRAAAWRIHGRHHIDGRLPLRARGVLQAPAPLGKGRLAEPRRAAAAVEPLCGRRPAQAARQRAPEPRPRGHGAGDSARGAAAGALHCGDSGGALALLRLGGGGRALAHAALGAGAAPGRGALRRGSPRGSGGAQAAVPALGGLGGPVRGVHGALADAHIPPPAFAVADLGSVRLRRRVFDRPRGLAVHRAGACAADTLALPGGQGAGDSLAGRARIRALPGARVRPRGRAGRRGAPLPHGRVREDMGVF